MIPVVRLEFVVINGGGGGDINLPPWPAQRWSDLVSPGDVRQCFRSDHEGRLSPRCCWSALQSFPRHNSVELQAAVCQPGPATAWPMAEGEDYPTMTCCSATNNLQLPLHHSTNPFWKQQIPYQAVGPGHWWIFGVTYSGSVENCFTMKGRHKCYMEFLFVQFFF